MSATSGHLDDRRYAPGFKRPGKEGWGKEVIFPSLETADQILVTAHGNSLRGIIKYVRNIPDEDIVHLNLPTAVPYVLEFDDDLNLVKDYFLGDPEEIKKLMEAVANQGKKDKK